MKLEAYIERLKSKHPGLVEKVVKAKTVGEAKRIVKVALDKLPGSKRNPPSKGSRGDGSGHNGTANLYWTSKGMVGH